MKSKDFPKKTIRIGVLGGIGPEATSEYYSKLINRLQQSGLVKSNKDFPQILINSIPAPELVYDTISESDLDPYRKGLKELDEMKVDFIVMVCNTIHLFFERLQKSVNTPIIDLREELKEVVKQRKVKGVLILGTPVIVETGLYRLKGLNALEPNKNELKALTKAIFNYNMGKEKNKQIERVKEIYQRYVKKGAETVILGCTELSLMLAKEDIDKINTINVLVEATVRRFSKER